MKKTYCVYQNFSSEAKSILLKNGLDLTMNTSENRPNGDELIALLKEYDILILGIYSKLTVGMINYVQTPKIIATLSIGVDHIDKVFFESSLVKIVNIHTANTISVAEHIFSLILALNKRICESNHLVTHRQGHRTNLHERPEDISRKVLGLIGAGNITREVIKIAKVFNMKIKCYTKHKEKHVDLEQNGIKFTTLDDVLENSDIINVSIPLNDGTRNLISRDKIQLMKPTTTFINTSRTDVVDIDALIEYADKYSSFYVGLDIDINNHEELFSVYRNNVIVTPHIAGVSKQAIERMDIELANNIITSLFTP